jgi:hypothetical protein
MALNKITYDNKVSLNPQPSIANVNKCTDSDLNEIKSVVNNAIDQVDTNTSDISTIQGEITTINGKLTDTGWVRLTITGSSVWERDNGATPRYRAEIRRIGNLVQVKGNLMANSNLSDNQSVSIPSASLSQFFTTEMEISGITNNSNWWVDTNGVFHISSSASSYININSCYMWTND